jgi:hemoglobin
MRTRTQTRLPRTTLSILLLSLFLYLSTAAPTMAQTKEASLYDRLGGYNAIAAVVDDFIGRLISDKQFQKFFSGFSNDSKKRIRQHFVDQICAATGGPCVYTGRDMKTTHGGLGITEKEWNAANKHLLETLDKFKVGKKEKDDVIAFVGTLKKDIVEK